MRRRLRRLTTAVASLAFAHAFQLPPNCATIGSALKAATSAFTSVDVPEASLSAEHLLAKAAGFGSDRTALSLARRDTLTPDARDTFESMCAQRLERVPVQYILGEWDFLDLTLSLRPPVLIPRPETEELVERVLRTHGSGTSRFLDVGCGSGAIGLALLHKLPEARCVGIDISADAIALASENAQRCGVASRYTPSLVDGGIAQYNTAKEEKFDVIVSNPPYIPRGDMASLEEEVAGHEDDGALCGGTDGLDVIRDLMRAAPRLLNPEGPRAIWMEVDTSHPPLIEEWLKEDEQAALQLEQVSQMDDLYGRPRFVEVRWRGA